MKLYFAWVKEETLFDPHHHLREDEMIFDLEITGQENEIPLARIKVRNSPSHLFETARKKQAFISFQKDDGTVVLLFSGRLLKVPQKIDQDMAVFFLTAEPKDREGQLRYLRERLQQPPYWDPLFVAAGRDKDPIEVLEGHSILYEWSRTTQRVQTTDLFEGRKQLDLKDHFFRDSLQISITHMPLAAVKVQATAEWMQQYQGYRDFSFILKTAFKDGFINSFTGPDLLHKWWKGGEKIAGTGYWVLHSDLKEIIPPSTGILNLYPKESKPLRISPLDPCFSDNRFSFESSLDSSPDAFFESSSDSSSSLCFPSLDPKYTTHCLKRYWYQHKLVLGFKYQQKRREKVEFTLTHHHQMQDFQPPRIRELRFSLQDVTVDEAPLLWQQEKKYGQGDQVLVQNQVYECTQAHTARKPFNGAFVS